MYTPITSTRGSGCTCGSTRDSSRGSSRGSSRLGRLVAEHDLTVVLQESVWLDSLIPR